MLTKISKLIYWILKIFDKLINVFSKNFRLLLLIKEFIEKDSYIELEVNEKNIKFFVPNNVINLRVNRILSKEPDTIKWINQFDRGSNIIFWDVGANIGLFSIYAATKHKNIKVISFEPSTSNLRVLSRNISINNYVDRIFINQFPLSNKENMYLKLKESRFQEGSALNAFGVEFNNEGKDFKSENSYTVYGTNIKYILNNNFLEIPDYIKIDVDGIEHLILEGADNFLSNKKIKSILVEVNENFKYQFDKVNEILLKNNFKFISSRRSSDNNLSETASPKNYIFSK